MRLWAKSDAISELIEISCTAAETDNFDAFLGFDIVVVCWWGLRFGW